MTDCFGKRYVSEKEFLDYARDLDLFTDHPAPRILEFLERHGILNPAARIRFPPEVVRRWHKERYPAADVPDPIEDDTPRLTAARTLHSEIFDEHWSRAEIYGERVHLLDDVPPAQAPFVQINFDPSLFMPWEEFQTIVQMSGDKGIGDSGIYARTCYHYWHVFPLAAFLRSGITILYDLNDRALSRELWEFRIADSSHEKLFATMNLEARHELSKILIGRRYSKPSPISKPISKTRSKSICIA